MPDLREPPFQIGLVKAEDPLNRGSRSDYAQYLRRFYYPQVANPVHLFEAKYNWDFFQPYVAKDEGPLSVFRRNAALPRGMTGGLVYCHWERRFRDGPKSVPFSCYAVEGIFPGEAVMAEYGCASASIFMDVARRGCDGAWFDHVKLIDWADGRTLCLLGSGGGSIATPWVTLLDTALLEVHMAKAERLETRPL